jgi:hypothetical protein
MIALKPERLASQASQATDTGEYSFMDSPAFTQPHIRFVLLPLRTVHVRPPTHGGIFR